MVIKYSPSDDSDESDFVTLATSHTSTGNLENQIFYGAVALKLTTAFEARFKTLKALRRSCPPLLNFLCLLNIVHYKI